ncbi:MAG: AbrB/MazE/SpoVT family DNA-binding domain-containing protein [Patescibacteria group bacterium]
MNYKQKLSKIGNSVGLVLPKQLLDNLKLKAGSDIYLEQIQDKIILEKEPTNSVSPEFLKIAENIGEKYSEAFTELAS